ncbi:MAG: hypothetical protein GWN58_61630, partial [Anaerolineae bacterium]|nr:hypothetical protein [Anaerolineae bacterium]
MNVPLRRDLEVLNRLLRPLVMAEASLLFGLGAAIGGYLGQRFSAALYLTGQTLVLAIVVAATSLTSFFTEGGRGLRPDHGERMEAGDGPSRIRLQWALYLGIVGLTVCATLGTVLLASGALGTVSVILLLAGILGAIAYSSPPFQLARSGYSELISTFLLA